MRYWQFICISILATLVPPTQAFGQDRPFELALGPDGLLRADVVVNSTSQAANLLNLNDPERIQVSPDPETRSGDILRFIRELEVTRVEILRPEEQFTPRATTVVDRGQEHLLLSFPELSFEEALELVRAYGHSEVDLLVDENVPARLVFSLQRGLVDAGVSRVRLH